MRFLPPGSNVSPPWIRTKNIWMFDIYFLNSSIKFFAWFLILLFVKRKSIIEFFSHIPECRIFLQATTKMTAQFLPVLYWSSKTDKRLFTDKAGMRSSQNSGYFNIKNRSTGDFFSYHFSAARYLILSKIYFGYDYKIRNLEGIFMILALNAVSWYDRINASDFYL